MFFLSHLIYSFSVIYGNTQSLFYELFYELILNPKLEVLIVSASYIYWVAASVNSLRIVLGFVCVGCNGHIEWRTAEHRSPQFGARAIAVGIAEYWYVAYEHNII